MTSEADELILKFNNSINRMVPIIGFCAPEIITLSRDQAVINMPFQANVKNHLGTIGFGPLAVGADCVGGLLVLYQLTQRQLKLNFVFSSAEIQFKKMAVSDLQFVCNDGDKIWLAISEVEDNSVKQTLQINVDVFDGQKDTVATFDLGLTFMP